MARTDPQLNFRCPPELKAKLEASARANARSLTAEIVQRLEASIAREEIGDTSEGTVMDLLLALERNTEALRNALPPNVEMDFKVSSKPRRNGPQK